jgi:hypothetical protein
MNEKMEKIMTQINEEEKIKKYYLNTNYGFGIEIMNDFKLTNLFKNKEENIIMIFKIKENKIQKYLNEKIKKKEIIEFINKYKNNQLKEYKYSEKRSKND